MSDPVPIVQLCTLAQVKERGGITTSENDDVIKDLLIPDALRRLQLRTGREFMPHTTATRRFDLTSHLVMLNNADLRPASVDEPITVVLHPELEAITLEEGTDYELDLDSITGTAGMIRLARSVSLWSQRAANFGHAQIAITGGWGIWASVEDVPVDVNQAAILTVLAGIDSPATDLSGIDVSSARSFQPLRGAGWDIPIDAWRKIQIYDRNLGVY